ncbi:MAG: hypothetical protein QOF64_677 [Candidatus Binatota bacterium]|nr:hypothetical protein [Candidatus Binatota bacterium]
MGADLIGLSYVSALSDGRPHRIAPTDHGTRNSNSENVTNLTFATANLTILIALIALPARVLAFCHELEVVQGKIFRAGAANSAPLMLEWMGHSTFQITSSKGTRILTDPHGAFDLPRPTLPQHIVTTSHQHGPHNSVHMAPGTPAILHGLTSTGENWQKIRLRSATSRFT